jgi:hypothetical protein
LLTDCGKIAGKPHPSSIPAYRMKRATSKVFNESHPIYSFTCKFTTPVEPLSDADCSIFSTKNFLIKVLLVLKSG